MEVGSGAEGRGWLEFEIYYGRLFLTTSMIIKLITPIIIIPIFIVEETKWPKVMQMVKMMT